MTRDPFPSPRRIGLRGTFPVHDPRIPRPGRLTARYAADLARRRLEQWKRAHGA